VQLEIYILIEEQEMRIYLQFSNPLCFSSDVTRNWYMCQSLDPLYIELLKSTNHSNWHNIFGMENWGNRKIGKWHSYNNIMIKSIKLPFRIPKYIQFIFVLSALYLRYSNKCVTSINSRWKYNFKLLQLIKYQSTWGYTISIFTTRAKLQLK
jgi:hypothetical protein